MERAEVKDVLSGTKALVSRAKTYWEKDNDESCRDMLTKACAMLESMTDINLLFKPDAIKGELDRALTIVGTRASNYCIEFIDKALHKIADALTFYSPVEIL